MMKFVAGVLLALALTSNVTAKEIQAFDFLIDGRNYVGQTVKIKGCTIYAQSSSIIFCEVRPTKKRVGLIVLDGDKLNRGSLRQALEQCNKKTTQARCKADVEGHVEGFPSGNVQLLNATIHWHN